MARKYRPKIVLLDAGYGNNTNFLQGLEERNLKYLAGVAKNRKVRIGKETGISEESRIDEFAQSLSPESFEKVLLRGEKPRTLLEAEKTFAIVTDTCSCRGTRQRSALMNASSFQGASDIDYFITNVESGKVTAQWVVETYSQRNWVEVFYREALMMVRAKRISSPRARKP